MRESLHLTQWRRGPRAQASRAGGTLATSSETGASPTLAQLAGAVLAASFASLALLASGFGVLCVFVSHTERLEATEWLGAFALGVPVAYVGARWLLRHPVYRDVAAAGTPLAVFVAGVTVFAAHQADGAGARPVPLPWSLLLFVVPAVVATTRYRHRLGALLPQLAWGSERMRRAQRALLAAAGGVLGIAAFLPAASWTFGSVVLSLGVLGCVLLAGDLLAQIAIDRRVQLAVALAVPLLLALLVWDVSFQPNPHDQDFFLGPANDIRHGRYMLVDVYSQYGVGNLYFITAILDVVSFGYGGFVLLLGALTALMIVTVYAVLRIATGSTVFAGAGAFIALLSGPIGTMDRVTEYPSVGFLRFGISWLLVLALVLAFRNQQPARAWLAVAYVLVGISTIWSFEAAFYTVGTFVVAIVALAWMHDGTHGARARRAARHLAAGGGAAIVAITALVVATDVGRGQLPHPRGYVDFIRLYSSGNFGTLPIPDWSLGYLICAAYVTSFVAIAVILGCCPGSTLARPSTLLPIVMSTAFGALSLTYFLGRSHPNNLTHVSPPFVVMITLWTALAARAWRREGVAMAAVAALLAIWSAAILVTQDWSQLELKAPDSALAAALSPVTGKPSLSHDIRTLIGNPVIDPNTTIVETLVQRTVPPGAPLLVAVDPQIATEIMIRLDRSSVLPISAPTQDGLVPRRRDAIIALAARVPCDTRVVTQGSPMVPSQGQELLDGVLAEMRRHFRFSTVASVSGYTVSTLSCKR